MHGILTNRFDMEKVKQWVEELKSLSPFAQSIAWLIRDGKGEGYEVEVIKGRLQIKADSLLGGAYAILHFGNAFKASHTADFMGYNKPKYPLRPLWIPPDTIDQDKIEELCKRTIELGFNAWIVGSLAEGMFDPDKQETHPFLMKILHQYCLKLILKPRLKRAFAYAAVCPLDLTYKAELTFLLHQWLEKNPCDAIFWESAHLHYGFENSPSARDYLHSDLVMKDLQMLEDIVGKRDLIYYLPSSNQKDSKNQSRWMSALCDRAGKNTTIAFPAVAGRAFDDHLPPHPFWEEMRLAPDSSGTLLLPILNCGAILQGEGLWPGMPLDLIQNFMMRSCKSPLAGFAVVSPGVPRQGSFLDGSLWIAAQAQWRDISAELLWDTWRRSYRAQEQISQDIFGMIREVIKDISYMRSMAVQPSRNLTPPPECRARIEKTIASFKYLDLIVSSSPIYPSNGSVPFKDYYEIFAKDAKKMIAQLAQHLGVPTPHLLPSGDQNEGFWSDQSYPEGTRKWIRETPKLGQQGSRMARIYTESRI